MAYDDFSAPVAPTAPEAKTGYDAFSSPVKTRPAYDSDQGPYKDLPVWLRPDNAFGRLTRSLEQGATFGLNTEVAPVSEGLVSAGKRALGYDAPTFSEAYSAAKERELAKTAASRNEFSIAPELLGGLGSVSTAGRAIAQAPGYFSGIGRTMATAAPLGAIQGATDSNGTATERLGEAVKGAAIAAPTAGVIHGLISPTVHGLGAARRFAMNALERANNPEQAAIDTAIDTAADTLVEGGISPQALTEKYTPQYLENSPTPLNVMDIAKLQGEGRAMPMTRKLRGAINVSPNADLIQEALDRQANQAGRANQIIENATNGAGTEAQVRAAQTALPSRAMDVIEQEYPGSTFEKTAQRLDAQARAQAMQNYEQLHAQPDVVVDEDLGRLMATPLARSQWEKARILAEAEGRPIPTYDELTRTFGIRPKGGLGLNRETGFQESPDQYTMMQPPIQPGASVPVRALDYFQRALRLDAEKGGTEGHAFNALRQRLIEALDPAGAPERALVPGFRNTMSSYRAGMEGQEALQSGYALKPEVGQASREALVDFADMTPAQKELFRMGFARKLQDLIQAGDAAGAIDKLNQSGAQRIINQVFDPDVAQRISQGLQGEAATSRAMQQGMEMTRNLGSGSRQALEDFQRMTPAQQELFRQGFTRKLMDMVSNKVEGADAVRQFRTDAAQQMIRSIYPPSVAEPLIERLSNEGVTTSSLRNLFGNSTTAPQTEDIRKLMQGPRLAADLVTGRWWKLIDGLSMKLGDQIGEKAAKELQRTLLTTDPQQIPDILKRLAAAAKTTKERQAYVVALREARAPVSSFLAGLGAQKYFAQHARGGSVKRGPPRSSIRSRRRGLSVSHKDQRGFVKIFANPNQYSSILPR